MPKVSFASADFYEPKLGFTEGWFVVAEAKTQVYQYNPSRETGEQTPPFLAAVLSVRKLDDAGNVVEEEPLEKVLRIEKDLSKMRPGQATSREDPEPSDMGGELNTEGNTVYAEEGVKINANSAWAVFSKSLEERGFKPTILFAGYLPDLVGMKAHATTQKGEKRTIAGREIEPNYLVVDKITVFPYEAATKTPATKKPAASAKTVESAKAPQSKANGLANGLAEPDSTPIQAPASAASTPVTAAASSDDAATAVASRLLSELSVELAGETRDQKKLFALAFSRLIRDKNRDKKLDKAVQELLKSEEFLVEQSAELGYDYDGQVFTFGDSPVAA